MTKIINHGMYTPQKKGELKNKTMVVSPPIYYKAAFLQCKKPATFFYRPVRSSSFFFFLRFDLFFFSERVRREGEKHLYMAASRTPLLGTSLQHRHVP